MKRWLLAALGCVAAAAGRASAPAELDRQADALLRRLSLEQEIDLLGGVDSFYLRALPAIGLGRLKMSDGPLGVRSKSPGTAYAGGVALAASWDVDLAREVGASIGEDARERGIDFLLGPGVNLYRTPLNGRNSEYFGEDPLLAGRLAVAYIQGVQSTGVVATVKHFAANNAELNRRRSDSVVDERTLRELYLPAFELAVKEGHVGAVMNSYNLLNGEYATQNAQLNRQILKEEWGFRGILISDWGATHDGVAAALAGLDVEMPAGDFMNRETLLPGVAAGTISRATIDDKVRRILRTALVFHLLGDERTEHLPPVERPSARASALRSAQESIVLLKNEGNLLPLDAGRCHRIAVLGPCSFPAITGNGGSAHVTPTDPVSSRAGIAEAFGPSVQVSYARGIKANGEIAHQSLWSLDPDGREAGLWEDVFSAGDFTGAARRTRVDRLDRWREAGGWGHGERPRISKRYSGYLRPSVSGSYRLVADALGEDSYRLFIDGRQVLEQRPSETQAPGWAEVNLTAGKPVSVRFDYQPMGRRTTAILGWIADDALIDPEAVKLAAAADAVVVCVGFDVLTESEGHDHPYRLPPGQDELIAAVEAANPKAIVVLTCGGGVDTSRWINRTAALLHGFYGGEEAGRALGQVLVGAINPSGRLPMSFERRLEDNPASAFYAAPAGTAQVEYREGIFLGYRYYDQAAVKPLFPFGFGLSYTGFAFSNLGLDPEALADAMRVSVSFDVTNTGRKAGATVAQIYVGDPSALAPRPVRELKSFLRVFLQPGERRRVSVLLDRRAFAYWDVRAHDWRVDPGNFTIWVGDSSTELPLRGDLSARSGLHFAP